VDGVAIVDPRVLRSTEAALGAARSLLVTKGIAAVTHLNVAAASGVGRKTMYRHWPTVEALLYDTFSSANFPHAPITGNLRIDLIAHLEALRRALVDGPLKYLIHALNECASRDHEIAALRDRLTDEGCEPVRAILRAAIRDGTLPRRLDVEAAAAQLEGPLFYRTLVRNEPLTKRSTVSVVTEFLQRQGVD
jgi:AcrR family transcriptional regulator